MPVAIQLVHGCFLFEKDGIAERGERESEIISNCENLYFIYKILANFKFLSIIRK